MLQHDELVLNGCVSSKNHSENFMEHTQGKHETNSSLDHNKNHNMSANNTQFPYSTHKNGGENAKHA